MSRNSKYNPPENKPAKPYPEFPLRAHSSGRWCKDIRGKTHYFGRWDEPDAALAKYLDQKDALEAGLLTGLTGDEGPMTVGLLCEKFLTAKAKALESGKIDESTFANYGKTCQRMIKIIGKHALVAALAPEHFAVLIADMEKTWGPVRVGVHVVYARMIFRWGCRNGKITKEPAYGDAFCKPSAKIVRLHKAEVGPKYFEPTDIHALINAASQPLKSIILLGINGGFGNGCVSRLPMRALNLETGWINFPRPKTGVARRVPLWPETVEAIREWLRIRPHPKDPKFANLVFVSRRSGNTFAMHGNESPLSNHFRKFADRIGINGTFYWFRHTFQTVGDNATTDFVAVRSIMAHVGTDMADNYREHISDERLKRVVNGVRTWLINGVLPEHQPKHVHANRKEAS